MGREIRRMYRDGGNVTPRTPSTSTDFCPPPRAQFAAPPSAITTKGRQPLPPAPHTSKKHRGQHRRPVCPQPGTRKQLANSLQCGLSGFQSVPLPPRSQLRHDKADHGHRHGDSQYCVKRGIRDAGPSHVYPRGAWHKYSNCDIIARV